MKPIVQGRERERSKCSGGGVTTRQRQRQTTTKTGSLRHRMLLEVTVELVRHIALSLPYGNIVHYYLCHLLVDGTVMY